LCKGFNPNKYIESASSVSSTHATRHNSASGIYLNVMPPFRTPSPSTPKKTKRKRKNKHKRRRHSNNSVHHTVPENNSKSRSCSGKHATPGERDDSRSRSRTDMRKRKISRRSRSQSPKRRREARSRYRRSSPSSEGSPSQHRARSKESRRDSNREHRRQRSPEPQRSATPPQPGQSANSRSSETFLNTKDLHDIITSLGAFKKPTFHNNVVPTFDPSLPGHRVDLWINKVNQCASIYGWDDLQTIHFSLQKLAGNAKTWYDSLPSMLFTWREWQDKLLSAFPFEQNYGKLLDDMLRRKYKLGESIENYFYEKMSLINQCQISGKHAVDCIIYGLSDRTLRTTAQSLRCKEPEQLFEFLASSKEFFVYPPRFSDSKVKQNSDNVGKTSQICFNCRERGHVSTSCPKPLIKCTRCNRIGHKTENCFTKDVQDKAKSTNVICNEGSDAKYYKNVKVNNNEFNAFIDLGSEVTIIRSREAALLGTPVNISTVKAIKSFGNSTIPTLGELDVQICVDDVTGSMKALVVDDRYMNVPVLIGQDFTDQPHVLIVKNNKQLNFYSVNKELPALIDEYVDYKIRLSASEDKKIVGQCTLAVCTEPKYCGDLYVPSTAIGNLGSEVIIQDGVYSFGSDGKGLLLLLQGGNIPAYLEQGTVVARAKQYIEIRSCFRIAQGDSMAPLNVDDIKIESQIGDDHKNRLITLLDTHRACFATNLHELGCVKDTEMNIELSDKRPVVYGPYRLSHTERQVVRDMVGELVDAGIVQDSVSDYASPVLLVKKKNGKYRLCVDYRALNNKTIKERYPMPIIEDQISRLADKKYFTALDLASGYYQIPISLDSRHLTAFVTPDGQYEFTRMPFGLANAPAVFQRMINRVLGPVRFNDAITYMDDILIASSTIDEGLYKLSNVLKIFKSAGLTLNLEKCLFLSEKIDFLGYEISYEGVRPGQKKIQSVVDFPQPKNHHQVRQFYGLVSYFRKFINDFASIAQPITSLLKKNVPFVWTDKQAEAFTILKDRLSNRPILTIYDPHAKFTEVHTDASKHGLAGILLQRKDSSEPLRVIAYYSRQTAPEEKNFHAYELETLAVVESLKKFRVYVLGILFKIVTDCRALRTTLIKRDLIPRIARWWLQLQEFHFEIEYRPGTQMSHVDALSRNIGGTLAEDDIVLHNEYFPNVMHIEVDNWLLTLQLGDDELCRITRILNTKDTEEEVKSIKSNYVIKNNQLYRYIDDDKKELRWVVPKGARWQICKLNHDDIGHFAFEKTFERIKKTYWFPHMRHFVKKYVKACLNCAYHNDNVNAKEGYLHPIEKISTPFHTLHIDHLGPFVRSKSGNMYLLVIVDAFTKYVFIKPVRDTKTRNVTKILDDVFYTFRIPSRIICDRGSSFTSHCFKQFCQDRQIKVVYNAVACPRANGQVERYNRTILKSLSTQNHGLNENVWDAAVGIVQWGLNNTLQKSIGKTPAEVLFGVAMNCEINSQFDPILEITRSSIDVDEIREEVAGNIGDSQVRQKKYYDSSRKPATSYSEGDLVKISKVSFDNDGKSKKLLDKHIGPFKVVKVLGNDRYQLSDIEGFRRKSKRKYKTTVSADRMQPWIHLAALDLHSDE
jgi:hypothetical protein